MTARTLVKALALAAALMPLAAAATVVMQLTMEELADRSPVIVRATVEGSKPVARADGSIWTVTRLAVTERLKGAGTAQVVVKQPGGEIGGRGQRVLGTAKFREGDDVIVFLEPSVDEKNVFVVQGLASGKVNIETINGQKVAVRHLDGLSFAKSGTGRVQQVENLDRLGTVDAFLSRLRAATTPPAGQGGAH